MAAISFGGGIMDMKDTITSVGQFREIVDSIKANNAAMIDDVVNTLTAWQK
jgi:hypothetical protein